MNVVIINLTRFGDLLQLQPTILGLAAKGHKVGLICLENFLSATALMRGLSYVRALPSSKFLSGLDNDWRLALNKVEDIVQIIEKDFPPQIIINTTSTLGSRLLSRRLANSISEHVPILGFGLDDDGFGVSGDMWTTFLQGASNERLNCPFNLVDMFRSVCGVAEDKPHWGLAIPSLQVKSKSLEIIQTHSVNFNEQCKGYIAFQLGASNKKRQWPVEHFAKLGAKIWQEQGLCPILLGSAAEQGLGEAYAKHALDTPFVNTIGVTDILHLAGILCHCKMLVTNDTGTMHLAAGLKIPTLAIFLATAQAWDTGPYMPDCCCLEPALPCHPCAFHKPCIHGAENQPCLHGISAETVAHQVLHYLKHNTWTRLEQNEARIWRSIEGEDGFASLEGLSGHEHEERSHWLMMQRYFYRRILDNVTDNIGNKPTNEGLSTALRMEVGAKLEQATSLLLLLEKQIQIMQKIPSPKHGERLLLSFNNLHTILSQCQHLKALAHLWATISQEQGGDLASFLSLVQSLRVVLMQWQEVVQDSGM